MTNTDTKQPNPKNEQQKKRVERARDTEENSDFVIRDKRFWVTNPEEECDDSEDASSNVPSYVAELENKVAESEKQLLEYVAAYKSNAQEIQGFKERMEKDLNKKVENAKGDILLSLLPLEDNLNRAIDIAEETKDSDSLLDGIKMIRKLFKEQVKQIGLKQVEALNNPFDPAFEEAIAVIPVSEKEKDNIVIEEFEKGYKIGDRLLRPAKVKVGKFIGK